MEAVDVRFTSYANNKIPGVLSGYADDRGFTVRISTNIWDPTLEDAHTEISADRPFPARLCCRKIPGGNRCDTARRSDT